jgi:hypothetical protein
MKQITVTRTVTYSVDDARAYLRNVKGDPQAEVTDDEALDLIYEWAVEDIRSAPSRHDLVFMDENWEEL